MRGEETRCHFCTNRCLRTFLDIQTASHNAEIPDNKKHTVLPRAGERRVIIAGCEKGSVEDLDRMREIKAGLDAVRATTPNLLVDMAAHEVWKSRHSALVRDVIPSSPGWRESVKRRIALMKARSRLRVGIPRVLNMWVYAPLFSAYPGFVRNVRAVDSVPTFWQCPRSAVPVVGHSRDLYSLGIATLATQPVEEHSVT